MFNPLLVLRQRFRHLARKRGAAVSQAVGNRPFLTGIAGTLIATAMAGLTLATLYSGRTDALNHARETSANLVSLISSDLARNVEIYDLSLQEIVHRSQEPTVWHLPDDLRRTVLFDRATLAAYLGGAYVVDEHGVLKATQEGAVNKNVRFDDRDYFVVHQRNPNAGLFVSHPYRSRLREHELSFALSRRIDARDGSFAGVALLAVRIAYLQRLLDKVNTGRDGTAFILHEDGTVLARKPYAEAIIGVNVDRYPQYEVTHSGTAGSFIDESPIDHVRRIYSYAHVSDTPLVVIVAPALDDVLAPWRKRSAVAGALTFTLGAVVVLVCWMLAFALRDKVRAQARLAELAATDPLTRLSNRRTLDRHLDEEWRRARRNGAVLSVLFIDIDHFKRFNDTYGHAAGDEVLAAVADCIASVARRSIDVVARYGGEEFAVVLPDMGSNAAANSAEKVRRGVEALRIRQLPIVTVSVGCATGRPADGRNAPELLAAADAQLYAAKAAGRNQVQGVDWTQAEPDSLSDHTDQAKRHA
ncbi:diguanylate cyclase (GGDEF) domain-containing protein [Burkholderia sp. YR290]|uniref:diguanylate cyclase n=1 Tax=Paraburkholderia hospita TaxID=169430 RepID=A0ABN0F973_9BURK|nr:diguanylate cyclase [Paraburkholderia hospita]EIM95168.1 diguanylate cyclase [Paraburkholderia hospita]OUL91238.1 sensor domain-containing diguanylate cyclase [Paraburkholderia hospita]SKC63845.1 diguanylate cyclase (GGDEF) domain-containing protein [Burkholderia sp. CF099]SOE61338.1 diguanylate cyclase (GGDEF) domain-containing protein [Burkholderia sp. YR290]